MNTQRSRGRNLGWSTLRSGPAAQSPAGPLRRVVSCLAVAVAAVAWLVTCPGLEASPVTVTLLHVNDTHSHLESVGPKTPDLEGTLGGLVRAASVIAAERQRDPNLLLLHAGDAFHGDLFFNAFFGVPELQLMQQLGFDAMAVGNHEFDLGPDVLAGSLQAAYGSGTLPLLSANLDTSGYPALDTWIKPSVMKDVNGLKVGIFGMTVPTDPMTMPAPVVILGADDPAVVFGIAAAQVQQLRAAGADVVVCLSHLGVEYDEPLAANVPGIDVIVGGHNHYEFADPLQVTNPGGTQTLIVQAGSFYEKVGRLRLDVDNGAVTLHDYTLLRVDESVPFDPQVKQVVDQLKAGIVQQYGDVYQTVLARAIRPIFTMADPRWPARDTGMGNLITDAMRQDTRTVIALTTDGIISEGIAAGPIVGADLFRPVSYGYDPATGLDLKLVTFEMTGDQLVQALETVLAFAGVSEDFNLEASGLTFAYDRNAPVGSRVCLRSVRVGGKPIAPHKSYTVTVNEAAAMILPMLGIEVSNVQYLPDPEYTALRRYVTRLRWVHYGSQGRILDVSAFRTWHAKPCTCSTPWIGQWTAPWQEPEVGVDASGALSGPGEPPER